MLSLYIPTIFFLCLFDSGKQIPSGAASAAVPSAQQFCRFTGGTLSPHENGTAGKMGQTAGMVCTSFISPPSQSRRKKHLLEYNNHMGIEYGKYESLHSLGKASALSSYPPQRLDGYNVFDTHAYGSFGSSISDSNGANAYLGSIGGTSQPFPYNGSSWGGPQG